MKKTPLSTQLFWLILILQVLIWTIVPTFTRYALPHDTIECYVWGQHFQWGYDKNPWLCGWLAWIAGAIGGSSGWLIYLFSQCFVAMSLWSVWRLARHMFSRWHALVGVLVLEGCIYYTLAAPRFNDNCIELGLWSLMFLYFYRAIETQSLKHWLITGIAAALGMMTKYYTAIPLLVMFLFMLFEPQARKSFREKNLWIGVIVAAIIILPHVSWLFGHQFLTIKYAAIRTVNTNKFTHPHLQYPFTFLKAQIGNFILPLIFFFTSFAWRKKQTVAEPTTLTSFNKKFLIAMGLGPFLLTLLLSLLLGWKLFSEWGMPLVPLWGLLFLAYRQPTLTKNSFTRFFIIMFVVLWLWPIGYLIGVQHGSHSDNYPAKEIALAVTKQWHERYHKPLQYVAGSRYIAGYIAFYSPDHPSVLMEWNPTLSPWINMNKLKQYGAAFVQDGYYGTTFSGKKPDTDGGEKFPREILKQYPSLKTQALQAFSWHRAKHHSAVKVLVGFLPPEKTDG